MEMKNYDPNIYRGIHTVRITIQQWGYVGHIIQKVHGNCKGLDILSFDFECDDAVSPENDCNLRFHEEDEFFTATLRDEDGNTLLVDGDGRDFNKMIVAIEIIDFVEE